MNGPSHYREAERLLHEVNREQAPNFEGTIRPVHHDGLRDEMVAQAQVHATLAQVAATVAPVARDDDPKAHDRAWIEVTS